MSDTTRTWRSLCDQVFATASERDCDDIDMGVTEALDDALEMIERMEKVEYAAQELFNALAVFGAYDPEGLREATRCERVTNARRTLNAAISAWKGS